MQDAPFLTTIRAQMMMYSFPVWWRLISSSRLRCAGYFCRPTFIPITLIRSRCDRRRCLTHEVPTLSIHNLCSILQGT